MEELLAKRGIVVDHVTIHRRAQTLTEGSSTPPAPTAYLRVLDELLPAVRSPVARIVAGHGLRRTGPVHEPEP